jgi:hypothetical protein
MNLRLEQLLVYECEKEMRCDASEIFFHNVERNEVVFTHNEVVVLFKSRFNKISEKDKAVYFSVVDEETGELLTFNCRSDMHDIMVKYMLYPPIIQKLFV